MDRDHRAFDDLTDLDVLKRLFVQLCERGLHNRENLLESPLLIGIA
jgi:hypothetical protein